MVPHTKSHCLQGFRILMTWILLRAPHTSSQDLHGAVHTNHLDFSKGGSYKQPRSANGFQDRELSRTMCLQNADTH